MSLCDLYYRTAQSLLQCHKNMTSQPHQADEMDVEDFTSVLQVTVTLPWKTKSDRTTSSARFPLTRSIDCLLLMTKTNS